ncbi:MAG: acyltransferase [Pseudomonadota bacterium]
MIHSSAVVDEGAVIGDGTKIWHWTHISEGAVIGPNCTIGQNVFIGRDVTIGAGCKVQNNVSIYSGVTIEDAVFIGPSVVFTNVINPRAFIEKKNEFRETIVEFGATVGANSTIVCGVNIGRYALVGAASVVTRSVAPYNLVYGAPASYRGMVNEQGDRVER